MKNLIFILSLLCCSICLGQSYSFNKEIIYNCSNSSESQNTISEKRRYFINTANSNIVAILIEKGEDSYSMIFRDDKKDRIAEVTVDGLKIATNFQLEISRSFLVPNPYSGIMHLSSYKKSNEDIDSLKMKYYYEHRRKNNPSRIKSHTLYTQKVTFTTHPGIGFGDYYSRLKWDEELEGQLITQSFTTKEDGSITDDNRLEEVKDARLTVTFN